MLEKFEPGFRTFNAWLLILMAIFINCQKRELDYEEPEEETQVVAAEFEYQPSARICTWRDNKAAAYTIAFDDARASHHTVAAPQLDRFGIVGTFYINTKTLTDWDPWRRLYEEGHEIASHTWSHYDCTTISEDVFRQELRDAKQDIMNNIHGLTDVPSFAYPYGKFNDITQSILPEYHSSARAIGGVNNSELSDQDFMQLKGIGVYPPYNMAELNSAVAGATLKNSWIIVYFHSVSSTGESSAATIPLDLFVEHLEYVNRMRDSLWIATQREVVDYIKVRQASQIVTQLVNQDEIDVRIENRAGPAANSVDVDLAIDLPENWRNRNLSIINKRHQRHTLKAQGRKCITIRTNSVDELRITAH